MKITKIGSIALGVVPSAAQLLMQLNIFNYIFNPSSNSQGTILTESFFATLLSAGILSSLAILLILIVDGNSSDIEKIANVKLFILVNIISLIIIALLRYFLFFDIAFLF